MLEMIGKQAKEAAVTGARLSSVEKKQVLTLAADLLLAGQDKLMEANQLDVAAAEKDGMKPAFLDRLTLTEKRISEMAEGLLQVADLEDPIGEVVSMRTLPNGLILGKRRVPLGVVGIIFEARPNVCADAFGLCLKAGNASILRGGKEALRSNAAIVSIFQEALQKKGLSPHLVQLITDTSRETAVELMRLNDYIDVLIPRGGAGLIQTVVKNSTVPVIETGVGNCHIFVDESAKEEMAVSIIVNAKTQRPGVCNACESLLIHKNCAKAMLPKIASALLEKGVEIRGDETTLALVPEAVPATEEDWGTEYADYIISVKVVSGLEEAVAHIRAYGTGHSEAIITENYTQAQKFLDEVDAAAVYVNASTRFTDGGQFGFGAEIGISTQKLHARGPMGLKELTSIKYIIYGAGQIRE